MTPTQLDNQLRKALLLQKRERTTSHEYACVIAKIYEDALWKARLDAQGKRRYATWKAFCQAELGISHTWAYTLVGIVRHFTRKDVQQIGIAKLLHLVRVPTEERRRLLKLAAAGASFTRLRLEAYEARRRAGGLRPVEQLARPPLSRVAPPRNRDVLIVELRGWCERAATEPHLDDIVAVVKRALDRESKRPRTAA